MQRAAKARARRKYAIASDDIHRVFNDYFINRIVEDAKWPEGSDRQRFKLRVHEAALQFLTEIRIPTNNELHHEVAALADSARRWQRSQRTRNATNLQRIIRHLEQLSPRAREWLHRRARPENVDAMSATAAPLTCVGRNGEILSRKSLKPRAVVLPISEDLRDPVRRERAVEDLMALCVIGGYFGGSIVDGKLQPELFAPPLVMFPRKREAEENFVEALRVAWLEATGKPASWTANPERPGYFVRLVANCLMVLTTGKAPARLEPLDQKFINAAYARITAIYERRNQAEQCIKENRVLRFSE